MAPAPIDLAIEQIGKLHDGPDVVRLAQEIAAAFPEHADYWHEAGADTPWCGIFIAWVLMKCGYPVGGPKGGVGAMYVNWWLGYGETIPVSQRQPGDIAIYLGNPHHVTFVGDGDYIGGNQSDGVTRAHYRTPDAVRRPVKQATITPSPLPGARRFTGITATVFGGPGDEQPVAYSDVAAGWADRLGVSLPARFKGTRPIVRVWKDGRSILCPIVDVGPWNINDPYWLTSTRPEAESGIDNTGRHTNLAGIDLTPAAARAIGLDGKGIVDWEFVTENNMSDTPQPPAPIPSIGGSDFISRLFEYAKQDPASLQRFVNFALYMATGKMPTDPAPQAPAPEAPSQPAPAPSLPKWGFGTGILGTLAALFGAQQGGVSVPFTDGAGLGSLLSFALPIALSAFGAGGGPAALIARLAPSVFAALTQKK